MINLRFCALNNLSTTQQFTFTNYSTGFSFTTLLLAHGFRGATDSAVRTTQTTRPLDSGSSVKVKIVAAPATHLPAERHRSAELSASDERKINSTCCANIRTQFSPRAAVASFGGCFHFTTHLASRIAVATTTTTVTWYRAKTALYFDLVDSGCLHRASHSLIAIPAYTTSCVVQYAIRTNTPARSTQFRQ